MSAQLDFPPTPVDQATAPDLAKIDLQAVALAQFGDWRSDVAAATKKLTGVVLDLSTQTKVDEAKSLRQRTVNTPIAEVRKVSKALKSKLASVSKAIGAEEEAAVIAWGAVGELLTPQIDKREAELAAERAIKAQGEDFRKALHLALIDRIKGYVEQAKGLPSERIAAGVALVEQLTFGDECQELLPQYQAAHAWTLDTLRTMLTEAQTREAAEAQRLENERVAADLAAQKQALEAQAAELLRQREAVTHAAVFTFPEPEAPTHHPNGAPMYSSTTFKENGEPIMLDEHGKRSVFCDLADDMQADQTVTTEITEAQPPQQVLKATPAPVLADATDRGVAANESPRGGAMGAGQATAVAPAGEPATLKLGDICARLGLTMTAAFVADTLGIPAAGTDKRAVLYRESDYGRICQALANHAIKCMQVEQQAA